MSFLLQSTVTVISIVCDNLFKESEFRMALICARVLFQMMLELTRPQFLLENVYKGDTVMSGAWVISSMFEEKGKKAILISVVVFDVDFASMLCFVAFVIVLLLEVDTVLFWLMTAGMTFNDKVAAIAAVVMKASYSFNVNPRRCVTFATVGAIFHFSILRFVFNSWKRTWKTVWTHWWS